MIRFRGCEMTIRGDQRGQDMAAFAAGLGVPAAAISLGSSSLALIGGLLLIGP
jgi:hypothetical protein